MSQVTSWSVANGGGAAVRAAMNGIFGAIQTSSSGAAAPSPTAPGMVWLDTSGSPAVLKIRNAANTAWTAVVAETVGAKTVRGNSGGSAAAEADITMATLATMLGFSGLNTDPWIVFPNGRIFQWGTSGAIAAGGGATVTFGMTFPTACSLLLPTPVTSANNTAGFSVGARALTTSTAIITNNSGTSGAVSAAWFAIGY